MGCVNFKTEDFQSLVQQLPEGTPVYVLPEEVGNSLKLVELPNNKLWFKTQYQDADRNETLSMAINKHFGFN
jgi:tRNA pseudouridine-54 N-methylase